ncbi:HNH endonuclease [Brucella pituitosa]|uniref:HNH endonuclease n=1 Tax=Brucella pituitosa TaxID=571256 RepID=UPI003F4A9066
MVNATKTKTCARCNQIKEIVHFGKKSRNLDGLNYHCKVCINDQAKVYKANVKTPCSIDGCDKFAMGHGYCSKHYNRMLRNGSPTAGGTVVGAPMSFVETVALNYSGDECLTWPFGKTGDGYGVLKVSPDSLAHRVICRMVYGDPSSEDLVAAHSCGNGHLGCVNPKHLRWATYKENSQDMISHGRARNGYTKSRSPLEDKP